MASRRLRGPPLIIPDNNSWKQLDSASKLAPPSGALTPDLQPSTPNLSAALEDGQEKLFQLEHYIIGARVAECQNAYTAFDVRTKEKLKCKIFPIRSYRADLAPYYRLDGHPGIISLREVLIGDRHAYAFFECDHGDLHAYVRERRKLPEAEARQLFAQIAQAVKHCHDKGVVINQLKLRKFVFKDKARTQLMLDSSLEDARVLSAEGGANADDTIREKHGCPAYVSPEILDVIGGGPKGYSGRAADVWSMGVVLYTLLLGRYPFQDLEPTRLFLKIRQGRCTVPASLSSLARCLIKTMLRPEAEQRLDSTEILRHPWFRATDGEDRDLPAGVSGVVVSTQQSHQSQQARAACVVRRQSRYSLDQLVPDDNSCSSIAGARQSRGLKRKSDSPLAGGPPASVTVSNSQAVSFNSY